MLPIILEEVTPKNDDFFNFKREELWIRNSVMRVGRDTFDDPIFPKGLQNWKSHFTQVNHYQILQEGWVYNIA